MVRMYVRHRGLSLAVVLLAGAATARDGGCGNHRLQELIAPGGEHQATVFARDCGATTSVSTQVTISDRGDGSSGAGNVFVADADAVAVPTGSGGGPVVRVQWEAADSLTIAHHPRARIFKAETRLGGVRIGYVADSTLGSRPDA